MSKERERGERGKEVAEILASFSRVEQFFFPLSLAKSAAVARLFTPARALRSRSSVPSLSTVRRKMLRTRV